jgi:hypothetical protein
MIMRKKGLGSVVSPVLIFLLFSCPALAAIPEANFYDVKMRTYSTEPEVERFSISGHDQAYLVKPSISSYTQFNPLDPKAIYTIPPYQEVEFLPKLGKWMTIKTLHAQPTYLFPEGSKELKQAKDLVPAHWISLTNARGQYIIEPINYVFIVYETQQKQSQALLNSVLKKVGFTGTSSRNHSGGYYAYIGDQLLGQLATAEGGALTYSNRDFQFQNDHFRIFGSYPVTINKKRAFIFITSISEESGLESKLRQLTPEKLQVKLDELNKENTNGLYYENYGHHFVSFACARNNLAVALIKAGYPTYYSTLGNVVNTLGESTEDHDGNVYLTVIK